MLTLGGSTEEEPGVGVPQDPTLVTERGITQVTGVGQNVDYGEPFDRTYRTTYRVNAETSSLRFAWSVFGQDTIVGAEEFRASYEAPDGTLTPLTFSGNTLASIPANTAIESDQLAVHLQASEVFHLRVFVAAGVQFTKAETGYPAYQDTGNKITGPWTANVTSPSGPVPVAVIGRTRASVVCPAMVGDSIAAQGSGANGWWRQALKAFPNMPGLCYGRNANHFFAFDYRGGLTLRAATHAVVQYGANDTRSNPPVADLWGYARGQYAHVDSQNPGIPMYQTTCTPVCTTTDEGATLANQTLSSTTRLAWNAFLRDGAPCHPDTKAALAVGATGNVIRMGAVGHPLRGIIDVAAAVEEGGTSAPTGKWRVDLGVLSTDGVHPVQLGEDVMAGPTLTWLRTLTA